MTEMMERRLVPGLRRAMAEIVILRCAVEAKIAEGRSSANAARRAQVDAYRRAYNELNALLARLSPLPSTRKDDRND